MKAKTASIRNRNVLTFSIKMSKNFMRNQN